MADDMARHASVYRIAESQWRASAARRTGGTQLDLVEKATFLNRATIAMTIAEIYEAEAAKGDEQHEG